MSTNETPDTPAAPETPEAPGRGPLTRRRFLTGLGAAGAVAAGGYAVAVWTRSDGDGGGKKASTGSGTTGGSRRTTTTPSSAVSREAEGRTLVLVEFLGGNDSLNTVVPHADPLYAQLRPTLGVTDAIDLDGEIGLHPALKTLAAQFEAGRLAIVEGVGYPDPDLSHFASQAIWWTGRPESAAGSGWLGRYLDAAVGYDDPLAGVALGAGPSPVLAGDASFSATVADAGGLQPTFPSNQRDRDTLIEAWSGFGEGGGGGGGLLGEVRSAIEATISARDRLAAMLATDTRPSEQSGQSEQPGQSGQAGRPGQARQAGGLVESLTLAARLAGSETPPRIVHVRAAGDYDLHQGQAQRQPVLMQDLDAGIAAFLDTLDGLGVSDRVVLMTASEFGRRARENGTGTDHGTAAAHFVLGTAVKGGRYGEPPDLGGLDDTANLVHTLDYRSYYAAVLDGWLGADPEALLGSGLDAPALFS